MEFLSAGESPCNQYCTPDASADASVVLTRASSSCSDIAGPDHPTRPAWLSVAVTAEGDVVVQVSSPPQSSCEESSGALSSSVLAACRGVVLRRSSPDFARVSCANLHEIAEQHPRLLSLPLTATNIVGSDVSTHSTIAFQPTKDSRSACPSRAAAWLPLRGAVCCTTGFSGPTAQKENAAPSREAAPPTAAAATADKGRRGSDRTERGGAADHLVAVAHMLPTISLVLRSPHGDGGRGLLLLRPAVRADAHNKYSLNYTATVCLVSESVRLVALTPGGDGAYVLSHRFADVSSGGETHLVLRGGHADIVEGKEVHPVLRPLVLHVGLCGSSASQLRSLRSLLRCAVSNLWCRWGTPCVHSLDQHRQQQQQQQTQQRGLARQESGTTAVEVVVYSTEGHVLVFQPVPQAATQSGGESDDSHATLRSPRHLLLYTCSFGTRLAYSLLSGAATAAALSSAPPCKHAGPALLVAPPWRFLDQWRHSTWLRAALERDVVGTMHGTAAGAIGDGAVHRRRRHSPSTVLAVSANCRTWLIRAGAHLSLVSVPAGVSCETTATATTPCCTSACVVTIHPHYTLHDVQFVQAGGHSGFLLLCCFRGPAGGAGEEEEGDGGAVLAGASHAVEGRRYVNSSPSHPLRVFFLSLLAMSCPGRAAPMHASLLPLPVRLFATPPSTLAALLHASHRLRFVSVCAPDSGDAFLSCSDVVQLTVASSGSPRVVWTASAVLPSLSSWCHTHILRKLACAAHHCGDGVNQRQRNASLLLSSRVEQWLVHAFAAAWPCAIRTPESDMLKSYSDSPPASQEAVVEMALLSLGHTHHTVHDILHHVLRAFVGVITDGDDEAVAGEGVAGVTAVFAAFSTALRMSGMLGATDNTTTPQQRTDSPATMSALAFLHSCSLTLRYALEGLCTVGHISALLACVSHLTTTVSTGTSVAESVVEGERDGAELTTRVVWRLLLQPLFDLVWGVLQDYGVAAELTRDLISYCSPAVRAMVTAAPTWWPRSPSSVVPLAIERAPAAPAGESEAPTTSPSPLDDAPQFSTTDIAVETRPTAPASAPAASSTTTAPASAYSSTELYEVVRRVFLLQGAAAALRLVDQLRQHESTRDGVAEMAAMYEAMQKRLDGLTA